MPRKTGPPPKRSTQRRRRNKSDVKKAPAGTSSAKRAGAKPPAKGEPRLFGPALPGTRHSAPSRRFWQALRESGQAQFYEPSDWAAAELVVLAIDAFVKRPSAHMLTALNSAMAGLLVTEGERRRLHLELEAAGTEPATGDEVTELDAYRRRVTG